MHLFLRLTMQQHASDTETRNLYILTSNFLQVPPVQSTGRYDGRWSPAYGATSEE